MSDLSAFRDHARAMSKAKHKPECVARSEAWGRARAMFERWRGIHWADVPDPGPRPECKGCVTSQDRALWARLADEADAYLSRNTEEGLFT
jgi:hypothetical protein